MREMPLVSVVLPVYNRETKVIKTIKSILTQTYKNFELIIVDNASTDDTVKNIRELKDARIKLFINEENKGQTYSLNRGLDLAKGKYIARIDSDDIADKNRLLEQVSFMEKHSDYVLCGSWVQYISENDEKGRIIKMCSSAEGFELMQSFACGMYHPAAMYRAETIRKYSIKYNPSYKMAEDYDFWDRITKYGKGMNIPKVLLFYRRDGENDSVKHAKTMEKESFEIRRRICNRLVSKGKLDKKTIKAIDIEEAGNQSILRMLRDIQILRKYVLKKMDRKSVDYSIIRANIIMKVYGSCIAFNNSLYARIIKRLYKKLRRIYG